MSQRFKNFICTHWNVSIVISNYLIRIILFVLISLEKGLSILLNFSILHFLIKYNYIVFSLTFSTSKPYQGPQLTLKYTDFFLCYCCTHMHMYACMHLHAHVFMHIYSNVEIYIEMCINTEIQSVESIQWSPSLSISWLTEVVLSLLLGFHEISYFHVSISTVVGFDKVWFKLLYCWGITGKDSLSFLGDTLTQGFLIICHLHSFFHSWTISPEFYVLDLSYR